MFSWSAPVASSQFPSGRTLPLGSPLAKLDDASQKQPDRVRPGRDLTFLRRTRDGHRILLTCLQLSPARVLHMPGEWFVEHQLAAQQMRSGEFIALAAYGDCGPGYIGTEIAYGQGGYETGIVSRVAQHVEQVLMGGMKTLLSGQ